jgi:streptogramin lyase
MRRIVGIAVTAAVALSLLSAAPSGAFIVQPIPLASPTTGIALGPDGNLWVSERDTDSVARLTPGGALIKRFDGVGDAPGAMVTSGGRVWVVMENQTKVVWFDATSPNPTPHDVSIAGASTCGASSITAGGGQIYMGTPACQDGLIFMADDGSGCCTSGAGNQGRLADVVFHAGSVFASSGNGNVLRLTPDIPAVPTWLTITSGAPGPIAFDGLERAWVPESAGGKLYRIGGANGSPFDTVPVTGGPFAQPRSIVAGADGRLYVTGGSGGDLIRIDPGTGGFSFFPIAGGGSPFRVINGPDGDFYFTDSTLPRVLHFVNAPPRAFTGAATAVSANAVAATGSVDTRGNDTSVVFDYGPTTNYGSTSPPVSLPAGLGGIPVTSVLTGLAPGTTYHVRARATNGEGLVAGADASVTTPNLANTGTPILNARATFTWAFGKRFTVIKKFRITGLKGGETATIRCSTKKRGCPFAKKTLKKLKKGSRKLDKLLRKRHLKVGAKLDVRITKTGAVGSSVKLTVRRGKDPKVVRGCLPPGAKKPKKC